MPFLAAVAALMVMYWNSGKFSLSGAEMSISATFVQLIESMGFALAATAVCGPRIRNFYLLLELWASCPPTESTEVFRKKKSGSHSGSWLYVDVIPCSCQ